jgi:hypothetical protein
MRSSRSAGGDPSRETEIHGIRGAYCALKIANFKMMSEDVSGTVRTVLGCRNPDRQMGTSGRSE